MFEREFESALDIPGVVLKQARKLAAGGDEIDQSFALAYVLERRQDTFEKKANETDAKALARYMETYGLRRVTEVCPQDDDDEGK